MLVKVEIEKIGLDLVSVDLGVVEISDDITETQLEKLRTNLSLSGLELLENKKQILVERIKNVIIDMVHNSDEILKINDSDYISEKLGYDYTYLSNTFTEVKGITIQQFVIQHKIERVKELLLYDEMTLTEIAWQLHYSSVAHLSNQFKKVTGLTPTFFKELKHKRIQTLESL